MWSEVLVGRLSGGGLVLAGAATRTLARDHHALEEELASPDAPGLTAFECAVEAQRPDRAVLAQRLGELHVAGRLGEPQLRVVDPARQQLVVDLGGLVVQLPEASASAVPSVRTRSLMVMFHLLLLT